MDQNNGRVMVPIEKRRKDALLQHVQSPTQQASNFVNLVSDLSDVTKQLSFDNPLDDILRGLVGGDLLLLIGRTGNAKTSLMLSMARSMARRVRDGTLGDDDSIVVFASLEQNVEVVEIMLAGSDKLDSSKIIRGEMGEDETNRYAATRSSLPLWVLGQTRGGFVSGHKELYLETIIEAVESIIFEYDKRPIVLFVDYLQVARLRDGDWQGRHQQVMHASDELKRLAMRLDIPVILGSQARQAVDTYKDKQPQLMDSSWSGEASFVSDAVVSIQLLARNFNLESNPEVEVGGEFYENTGNTLVARVLKQRFDQGYGQVGFQFIPQTLEISRMNTLDLNLVNSFVGTPASLFGDE